MKASVVAIGDELLTGKIKDENISFAAKYLHLIGMTVLRAYLVGDDEHEIKNVLNSSAKENDVVIVSGGLGPTPDDRTKEAVASLLNVKLKFSRKLWNSIKRRFEERGIAIPETNRKQATLPDKTRIIENPLGTAPGFTFKFQGTKFFFLPGVPREFREMFIRKVVPSIAKKETPVIKTFRIFGLPESEIALRLKEVEDEFKDVKFSYLPIFPENMVLLSARRKNVGSLNKAVHEVRNKIGDYIYSEGEMIEEVVGRLLKKLKLTLGVAESCTGGMIASMITNVPGSSKYFIGGIVAYSYSVKENFLGVDKELLQREGAVNEIVAKKMAESVREKFNSDVGISTTGILGPSRGGEKEEVGVLYTGIAHKQGCSVTRFHFPLGDRKGKKTLFATYVLDRLRRFLLTENTLRKYKNLVEKARERGIAFVKNPSPARKILIFPITANPPTLAHSFILKDAMNRFSFKSVLILIDVFHADKPTEEVSIEERVEMARLAFSDLKEVGIGLTREGLYVRKLELLMNLWRGRNLTFLVGADNVKRILDPSFYTNPEKELRFLFSNAGFIIMSRAIFNKEKILKELHERGYLNPEIEVVETPESVKWISSTEVRERLKNTQDVSDFVDYRVKNFIDERGLYS